MSARRSAVYEVDPETGRVLSSETFAEDRGEGQWQIHPAEGKLIAPQSTPSESHLVAIRPGQAEPIWSETYPGVSSVYRVDEVLVGHRDEEKAPSVVFR